MVTELWMEAVPTASSWQYHADQCTSNNHMKDESYYMKNGNALFLCNRKKATPTIDWIIQRDDVIQVYEKYKEPEDFNSNWW